MTTGMPCPVCGTPRRAEAVFCHNCGASLVASPPAPPEPAASVEASPANLPITVDYTFCPRCGTAWVAGAEFCFNCGFHWSAAEPKPAQDPDPPKGEVRNLFALAGLILITFNIYWVYWVYQTYKDVRAHSPGVTEITAARAAGFMFIPLFNLIWAFRLIGDLPRAVANLQAQHPLGEPILKKSLASGLWGTGLVFNLVVARFSGDASLTTADLIVFFTPGELLFLVGVVMVQRSLNQHWALHPVRASEATRIDSLNGDVGGLLEALRGAGLERRESAARTLGELGDPRAVQPLIAALDDAEYIERGGYAVAPVSEAAQEALARLGAAAVEPLIAVLHRRETPKDWRVRLRAAKCLGRIGDIRAIQPLITALGDEEKLVRAAAVNALIEIGGAAREPLRVAVGGDDEVVRLGANEALAAIGDEGSVEPIITALQAEDLSARKQAARALGALGDPRAVEPLVAALDSSDADLRAYAAQSLVMIPAAETRLVSLLIDEDPSRRIPALSGLEDAVRFGSLKEEPRTRSVLRQAVKGGWGKVETVSLLYLMREAGDERANEIFLAIQSDSPAVDQMIAEL